MVRARKRFAFTRKAALGGGFALAVGASVPALSAAPGLPAGGSVAVGSIAISRPSQTSTLVTQSSQKALINWQSFGVNAGSSVTFQQPNAAAITLNRVVGPDASAINGNVFANGQVWLINRNGILFGRGSSINVGGLIATTSDIRDADFIAGNYNFGSPGNPNASIVNQGAIKTTVGGSAVLSGAHVVNQGVIEANLGKVVLGGANAFSVDFDGDNLIRYAITEPVTETPKDADGKAASELVANSGTISAQGGKVLLTARAARDVVDNVINSTGIIQATSASIQNGEIVLDAGDGALSVSGSLDASGKGTGETGGTVKLIGDKITVTDLTAIDAAGDAGGGAVQIGGALHGAGPEPNATTAIVGKAVISADAISEGEGGTAVIYSTGKTQVAAAISAKGGARSGNGGTVETSGHDLSVADATSVNTSAPAGSAGIWLLDPTNIIVATGGTTSLSGGVLAKGTDPGADDRIAPGTITSALSTTNVRLEATNDITVVNPVLYTSTNSLTFLAQHDVIFRADVQNAGSGSILAVGGWDGATSAAGILAGFNPGSFGVGGGRVTIDGTTVAGTIVAVGSAHGTTTVTAAALDIIAGSSAAQLGYHGAGASGDVSAGGNIDVHVSDLTLTGGTTRFNYAQLGNGHAFGNLLPGVNVTGNITVNASGTTTLNNSTRANGGFPWIGNAAGVGFIASGNIVFTTGDIVSTGTGRGIADYIQADLGTADAIGSGGNITITVTSAGGHLPLARDVFANSSHSLTLTSAGDLVIDHTLENISTGTIDITGGTVTIGGPTAVSDVAVGSRFGTVTVSTTSGDVSIEAIGNYAQIGFHGEGKGAITVNSASGVTLLGGIGSQTGGDTFAQIGNGGGAGSGGSPVTGSVSGPITVNASGDVVLTGGTGTNAYAQIGHGGEGASLGIDGEILVSAGGAVILTGGTDAGTYAQIGHGGVSSTTSILSDAITVIAGSTVGVIGGDGANAYAQIGDGGAGSTLNVSQYGAITVSGANIDIAAGIGSSAYAQIGHGGENASVTAEDTSTAGAITVTGQNIVLTGGEVDGIQYAQIGSGGADSTGTVAGDILVSASGTVILNGGNDNTAYAQIGHGGAESGIDASGTITVLAGSVALFGGGTGAYVQIGDGGANSTGSAFGDITVQSSGDVGISARDSGAYGLIGHGGEASSLSIGGQIQVNAGGAVTLQGGNQLGAFVQIGHGGANSDSSITGDAITVTAGGNVSLTAGSGENSYAQIGDGGAESGIDASGTITVQAGSGVLLNGGGFQAYALIGHGGLGSAGLSANGDILVTAGGNVSLSGGNDTDAYALIGHTAASTPTNSGAITVSAEGDVSLQGGSGDGAYAQVGHSGGSSSNFGDLTVNATNVLIGGGTGNAAYAAIGHGSEGGTGSSSGLISVQASGDVSLSAGEETSSAFAQIGHRANGGISLDGDISVTAGGSVTLTGADGTDAYAQLGHGGSGNTADASGGITVQAGDTVMLTAGPGLNSFVQIGHGGANSSGNGFGDINLFASTAFVLNGGGGTNAYAQAGHGGVNSSGSNSGAIFLQSGDITLAGGDGSSAYAQLGHGGEGVRGSNDGPISVTSFNGLQLTGGADQFAYAMIGHGGENNSGSQSGDIDVHVTGSTALNDQTNSDGGRVWIGNFAGEGGSASGNVSLITGNLFAAADPDQNQGIVVTDSNNALSDIILGDIQGGSFTLGLTDVPGFTLFDRRLVYNSPFDLTILSSSTIHIANSILNAGSGNLTIAAGWNPDIAPQEVVLLRGYGLNNSGVIVHGLNGTIGGSEGVPVNSAGGTAVASKSGMTTIAASQIALDANQYFAQIGYHSQGNNGAVVTGAINLVTVAAGIPAAATAANCMTGAGNICLSSGTVAGAYAEIGHLGLGMSGTASAPITIQAAGNVILSAGGQSQAGLPGMGQSTVANAYAQIGNGDASRNAASADTLSGNVSITAQGEMFFGSSSEPTSPAWIGNIGAPGSASSGDVRLIAQKLTRGDQGAVKFQDVLVADIAGGNVTVAFTNDAQHLGVNAPFIYNSAFNLTVATNNSIDVLASLQNGGAGAITFVAGWDAITDPATAAIASNVSGRYGRGGGSITIGGSNAPGDAAIGSASGKTTLAAASLTLAGTNGYAELGHFGAATGDIVANLTGGLSLTGGSGESGDFAQVGHGGAGSSGSNSGSITVNALGAISLSGGGVASAYAQIGHGGANTNAQLAGATETGNINLSGASFALTAGAGDSSYVQIGHGGEASKGNNGLATQGININSSGAVTLAGNGPNAYAQIGNGGENSTGNDQGNIVVNESSGALTLSGGGNANAYAQIGQGGQRSNGNDTGSVTILGLNGTTAVLNGGAGQNAYAQIGHGGANTNAAIAGATDTGSLSLTAASVALSAGTGNASYVQIGHGGEASNASNAVPGQGITVNSTGVVTLTGRGQNAYAQIGDGGQGSTGVHIANVTVSGTAVTLTGGGQNAYAQIGDGGQGSTGTNTGAISVTSSSNSITLNGGSALDAYAQVGNGGEGSNGSNSGAVAVTANNTSTVVLNGGTGQYAYVQLGHGGAESNTGATASFSDSGAITVNGASVSLSGAGSGSYSQIGNGGFESGKSLGSASATYSGAVSVTSRSSVKLAGGTGSDAYAQIGNAGGKTNSSSAAGATGATSGDISVTASPAGGSVTMTAGGGTDAYVQIGNGGFSANAPTAAPAGSFTIGGNVTVSDLAISGGNGGANSYGQIGNGDLTATGTGNVSGNVTIIAQIGTVTLTNGTAANSSAGIANAIQAPGTVSGTITRGDVPPPQPPPPPEQPEPTINDVQGAQGLLAVFAQTPPQTNLATLTAGPPPAAQTVGPVMMMAAAMPMEGTLESQEEPVPSDTVASSVGNSLSGEPGSVPSRTISLIGGLLRQTIPTLGATTPVGVPPADQDFSSSGNEALWQ